MNKLVQVQMNAAKDELGFVEWDDALPLNIGRQNPDENLFELHVLEDKVRLPVANREQIDVGRNLVCVESVENRYRVQNLKADDGVFVVSGNQGVLGKSEFLSLPFQLRVADITLSFQETYQTLLSPTSFHRDIDAVPVFRIETEKEQPDASRLISVLEQVTSLFQQETNESELFELACRAVEKLVPVDSIVVLSGESWGQVVAGQPESARPNNEILDKLRTEQRVYWGKCDSAGRDVFFLAAPIVTVDDKQQAVGAAIYVEREVNPLSKVGSFTNIEAQLVELICCSVGAGIVRIAHQRASVQFEQFFTPELARELTEEDQLLVAGEKEITVLICDIRSFSTISELLSPQDTSAWVQDVLSQLSQFVLKHNGVLVDFIGDEIIAMWGAPQPEPRHAELACQCALDMIAAMPEISKKWISEINAETRFGIGVNTGMAFVGNIGSTQKFKYGPLGDTVNRASRVQGLTKYLKVDALITGNTASELSDSIQMRRIGNARVVNISDPIDLFEIVLDNPQILPTQRKYQEALSQLESGDLSGAAERIREAIEFDNPDYPSLLMLREIIKRVISEETSGSYEWTFESK